AWRPALNPSAIFGAANFRANSTAPQTLSRSSGLTIALGQSLRTLRETNVVKNGCFSRTLPASTNSTCLELPRTDFPLDDLRDWLKRLAQVTASRARLLAAAARISVAMRSLRSQARKTS